MTTRSGRPVRAVDGRVFTDLEAKRGEHLGGRRMAQLRTMVGELAS